MLKKSIIFAAASLLMTSCTDFDYHQDHDTTISEFAISTADIVADLTAEDVNLDDIVTIEWEKAMAANYTQVFYKVLFSASGDFQNPDYSFEPASIGTETKLELSLRDLNIIAEAAGIPQNENGVVKWTVMASNGIVKNPASDVKTLTIHRPSGFAFIPDELALSGNDGTYTNLKTLSEGVFEGYVYLGDASFNVEDVTTGQHSYGISGNALEMNENISAVNPGKIHHVYVNFNTAEAYVKSVEEVGVWYAGINDVIDVMTAENPQEALWTSTFDFNAVDGNLLYKFRLTEKSVSGATEESFYGYASIVARPQTATQPANYFYLIPEEIPSQSDYCFSFNRTLHDGKMLSISVDMRPETETYTHTVSIL